MFLIMDETALAGIFMNYIFFKTHTHILNTTTLANILKPDKPEKLSWQRKY